jgi:hypothetical protein
MAVMKKKESLSVGQSFLQLDRLMLMKKIFLNNETI